PTIASTSRSSTAISIPSTALKRPAEVSKATVRFLISRRGMVSAPLQFRIERIAQAIADEVDGENRDEDAKAGEGHDPWRLEDEFAGSGEHGAPFRRRGLCAHAEEAERCRVENGVGKAQRCLNDQRPKAIGQDRHQHQPEMAG